MRTNSLLSEVDSPSESPVVLFRRRHYVFSQPLTFEGLSFSKGFMGFPQDSFFAVEFDTSFDAVVDDINGSHVGFNLNSVEFLASVNAGIDLVGGKEVTVWVGYSSENKPLIPVIVVFCACSEKGSTAYIVESWRFMTFNGSLPFVNPMDFWEEQGCLMCGNSSMDTTCVHVKLEFVFGLVGLAALVLSVLVVVICCVCGKKRKGSTRSSRRGCRVETSRILMSLSLEEMTAATMRLDRSRFVREGASAMVYKGCLLPNGEVAVKRFESTTEFARMAGCLWHKVLHGWCSEGSELVLVYEFKPNRSLNNMAVVLTWKQKLNMVLAVGSAHDYLHLQKCGMQTIYEDVKTCNKMLDAEFIAKLGDLGLAEVYEHSSITREAGTVGYLAPEYVYSGVPNVKTDAYSFGVVVIEVMTGRMLMEDDGTVIVDWVWGPREVGKLIEAADSSLAEKFEKVEMQRMLMNGFACVHPSHAKRPTVKEAAKVLQVNLSS